MSFIRHRSTRLMLPSLAIAALLALVTSALPASAATARPVTATCDTTPVFFGLHGMAEGPSRTISTLSPELESFDTDQNAISGAVLTYPVSYPTIYPDQLPSLVKTPIAVIHGEIALQADITAYAAGCSASQDRIALVGYSMGAWVINLWIDLHPLEWDMIKAVVLYGDPCWVDGNDEGLARLVARSAGCMPAPDYPYPLPGGTTFVPFPVQSWTMSLDPVTGADWGGNKIGQLTAATNCNNPTTCSHLDYTGDTEIYQGAQFVVSQLVG
jgi:pimeloyl-ACP methyl ester carboxylesterase